MSVTMLHTITGGPERQSPHDLLLHRLDKVFAMSSAPTSYMPRAGSPMVVKSGIIVGTNTDLDGMRVDCMTGMSRQPENLRWHEVNVALRLGHVAAFGYDSMNAYCLTTPAGEATFMQIRKEPDNHRNWLRYVLNHVAEFNQQNGLYVPHSQAA